MSHPQENFPMNEEVNGLRVIDKSYDEGLQKYFLKLEDQELVVTITGPLVQSLNTMMIVDSGLNQEDTPKKSQGRNLWRGSWRPGKFSIT